MGKSGAGVGGAKGAAKRALTKAKSPVQGKSPVEGKQPPEDDMREKETAASKTKSEYVKVERKARQLIQQIKSNAGYSSLKNDQNLGVLE